MNNQLIKIATSTGEVELSPEIVRSYLVNGEGKVSDQEVKLFMELCKYRGLNPFLKEAHLIKFGSSPAQIVVSYDVFKNRADANVHNKGWEAGIIVVNQKNELIYRVGALILPGETTVGGWFEGKRDDRDKPIRVEVSFNEYVGTKSDGTVNKQWATKPAFMIRKVAIAQGLREMFPNDLNGLYSEEENAPITNTQVETFEGEIVETVTKDDVMTMLAQASNFENGKDIEKGKKVLHQALVELELRELDTNYNELKLSTLTKNEYTKVMEKINEIKSRQ